MVVDVAAVLAGVLLRLAVAYALGSVLYLLARAGRRRLLDLDEAATVVDAHGRRWRLRVALAPTPLRYVPREDPAHPSERVERFEEAPGIGAWTGLALALAAVTVVVLEWAQVAVVAALVLGSWPLRGSWQCELVAPDGRSWHIPAGSLPAARAELELIRARIEQGAPTAPDGS